MRKFFYARVNTKDQILERQIVEAKKLCIEEDYVFIIKFSINKDLWYYNNSIVRSRSYE